MVDTTDHGRDRGVYGISVAADLVGLGVQSLRLYEAQDLLTPERTAGGTRRYSTNDLERLRRIRQLLGEGLNLAGIAMVLDPEAENTQLREERDETRGEYGTHPEAPDADLSDAPGGEAVPAPGRRTRPASPRARSILPSDPPRSAGREQ
jgi:DNA-binding transcriptional MerR regulator